MFVCNKPACLHICKRAGLIIPVLLVTNRTTYKVVF